MMLVKSYKAGDIMPEVGGLKAGMNVDVYMTDEGKWLFTSQGDTPENYDPSNVIKMVKRKVNDSN